MPLDPQDRAALRARCEDAVKNAHYRGQDYVALARESLGVLDALDAAEAREKAKDDLLETAWGLIANANEGRWSDAHPLWREAAERFRDRYLTEATP